MEKNLDGYGAPPIRWANVRDCLDQGLTQNGYGPPHATPLQRQWYEALGPCRFRANPTE
jgi:hypothetical protein